MPLTPFHLGPALLIGLLFRDRISMPAILAGSVLVDARAVLVFFDIIGGPLHGPLHTFIGAKAVAAVIAAGILALKPQIDQIMSVSHLDQAVERGPVIAGALVGTISHVILDGSMYTDMTPFWPLGANPMLAIPGGPPAVTAACTVAGLVGLGWYLRLYQGA